MGRSVRALGAAAFATCGLLSINPAHAIPTLQLYVEGAVYDAVEETWIGTPGGDGLLRVWAIGTAKEGKDTTALKMTNLRMSILFSGGIGSNEGNDADGLPISLVAADTTFNGFSDSWDAGDIGDVMSRTSHIVTDAGDQFDTVLIGATEGDFLPIIAGSDTLSKHGEFTEGLSWQEYNLPDMDFLGGNLTDITDFSGSDPLPDPDATKDGIIYAFTIDTSAFASLSWHFDLYGVLSETTQKTKQECTGRGVSRVCIDVPDGDPSTTTKNEFAPYSHDAGGTGTNDIPEPASLAILGLGLIGGALTFRRRFGPHSPLAGIG